MKFFKTLILTLFLISWAVAAEAATEIKLCILAPEGSTWMNVVYAMAAEVSQKTQKAVTFKLYPGGVCGDEKDVLRKMKINQFQAAAFTGIGLGEIVPEFRILELPSFLQNNEEIDYVSNKLRPQFEAMSRQKGFELLGFAEVGFIYLYANIPLKTVDDLKKVKMWMWQGDPVVTSVFKRLGVVATPLSLPDVLTSLQTGLIDGVYGPPLATAALQWHTKMKYMTDTHFANSAGAFLINKPVFDQLSKKDQQILREVLDKHCTQLTQKNRKENEEAIVAMKASGMKVIPVDVATREELKKLSMDSWNDHIGKLYSAEFFQQTSILLENFRKQQ